jgi:pimeloyl-ACP methyl ester carboxylesterase
MGDLGSTQYLPIAYLPGASGRSASWEPIASVLASRREPLLFDYPGLGELPEMSEIQDLADLTRWVANELPEMCDVVTLSMGSAIGLRLALDYPERVRRLVLVSPCGGLNVARFGAVDWRSDFVRARPQAPRWFVEDRGDFSPRLRDLSSPTLLVLGEQDLIAPPPVGDFLMARLPNAKLEVIQDANHDLEEEHPAFIASLIEAHLRR